MPHDASAPSLWTDDLRAHRCVLSGVGRSRETDPAAYRWDNNQRFEACLIQVTLGGEGRFRDARTGRTWTLPPGRGFLAVFPSDTQYWLPEGEAWTFLYAIMHGDCVRHHVGELLRRYGPVFSCPETSAPMRILSDLYEAETALRRPDPFRASAEIYRLLMELYREARSRPDAVPEPVLRAQRFAEAHYHEVDADVAAMARAAGYSRHHFSRLFRAHTGQSPYAYLLRVRLGRARDLLAETDLPVKRIGMMVGFGDAAHFCTAFRRRFGCTPGSVRRRTRRFGAEFPD